jgi:hypothetical protein
MQHIQSSIKPDSEDLQSALCSSKVTIKSQLTTENLQPTTYN